MNNKKRPYQDDTQSKVRNKVILFQPSEEKCQEIMNKIIQQYPEPDYHVEDCTNRNLESALRMELVFYQGKIIIISCHSGIEKALKCKQVIDEVLACRIRGKSEKKSFCELYLYSTQPLDEALKAKGVRKITKFPEDTEHTHLVSRLKGLFKRMERIERLQDLAAHQAA